MRLSKAQIKFLDRWVPTQLHWAQTADFPIGSVPDTGERKTFAALVVKEVLDQSGQITQRGLQAWKKATRQLLSA